MACKPYMPGASCSGNISSLECICRYIALVDCICMEDV